MLRMVWVLVLLLGLGAVVASGFSGGWTGAHVGIGLPVAVMTVVALMPTKQPAPAAGRGGR